MNDDEMYANSQEETIHVCNQTENEEKINKKLNDFFLELVNRRRNDSLEGGLQACIVIFPDKSAMKICESDGMAPHSNSFANLVKHLNGDYRYISLEGTKYFGIYRADIRQLIEIGIEIRIIDGEDEIMLAISSKIKSLSQYHIEILNKILFYCKMLKDNKTYDNVNIGVYISECKIDLDDLSDEHYKNILDGISSLEESKLNIK